MVDYESKPASFLRRWQAMEEGLRLTEKEMISVL